MLATLLGILGIAPVVWGIAALAVFLIGCGTSKKEDDASPPDAAPPPPTSPITPPEPEKQKCDNFPKEESKYMVDQQSYDTAHIIWKGEMSKTHMPNWHRNARIFFGADYHLFKTTCEDESIASGKVIELENAVTSCFGGHYEASADPEENGMLVLIHCIGAGKMDSNDFMISHRAMSAFNQTQADWIEVKQACHHFDKATENAANRFSKPSGKKLAKVGKVAAHEELAKAQSIIAPYIKMIDEGMWDELNSALTDRQQEILFTLIGAMNAYGPTLGKAGKTGSTKTERANVFD